MIRPIFAYLDPATGGVLIQSLIAAAVVVPFILRTQIARGIALIRRRPEPEAIEDEQPSTD